MNVFITMTLLAICSASHVHAQVTFEWVTIGNPDNAEDPLNSDAFFSIGSVADVYRIAKHEVTNAQYAEFLNAVAATDSNELYRVFSGTDARGGITRSGVSGSFTYSVKANMGNKPVNHVSYFDAMRFVNWLHNGQPSGGQDASTTEDGVYAITDGVSEIRAVDAQFFIPTENEWYKAAFHQPLSAGGDSDDFWLYPTASNSAPTVATADATGNISNPGTNVANYLGGAVWNGQQNGNVTTVGSAGSLSENFYGTLDQGGNVWEWVETVRFSSQHILRGGTWGDGDVVMRSDFKSSGGPTAESSLDGFRVASPASAAPPSADLDGNGQVDLADFAIFQAQFNGPE